MTTDAFEKIWEQASTRHPNGLVITIVPVLHIKLYLNNGKFNGI